MGIIAFYYNVTYEMTYFVCTFKYTSMILESFDAASKTCAKSLEAIYGNRNK